MHALRIGEPPFDPGALPLSQERRHVSAGALTSSRTFPTSTRRPRSLPYRSQEELLQPVLIPEELHQAVPALRVRQELHSLQTAEALRVDAVQPVVVAEV